ncbi:galactose oxidase [Gigaspora margarita]|uniref:Galactose oxidase n=1 Tax=Gigaspora margarita TaxID=4874 RepID=A0A8H4AW82_GIGMA|nr:galactose oxidase [Gigaspora margarita]
MPVGYSFGTSCLSPIDNSTVFLIGGRTWMANTENYLGLTSVYKFNSKTSQWTTPNINNFNYNFTTLQQHFFNDVNVLDITTMTWLTLTQPQSVLAYVVYTATLLPNGLIVYVGGRSGSSSNINLTDMVQIQIFDTKSYTWSAKSASGSIIASREFHSAVLTQDGNIIIYGGSSVPSVSGTRAPPLTQHSAALYKNYMILAFGATSASTYTSHVYILDIQNYTWVATFNVPTTTNPDKPTQNSDKFSTDQANNNYTYLYIGIGIGADVMSMVYTSGIPPPETYVQTPLYGAPAPGNN